MKRKLLALSLLLIVTACDREQPGAAPARPLKPLAAYFDDEDYPAAALRNHEAGTSAFTLEIGADGRVSDCAITASSGSSALDLATCRLLALRARFEPARDHAGRPTVDHVSGRITWRLAGDSAPPRPSA